MTDLLKQAYDAELFRNNGHKLVDALADHLKEVENKKVLPWQSPEEEIEFWENYLHKNEHRDFSEFYRTVMDRSISLHHPKYMGHQVAAPAPVAALSGLLSSLLNNGMAVYEMGAAATAIEKVIANLLARAIGYENNSDGFLTSGGTLATLTALLAARQSKANMDAWKEGNKANLAIMVSAEAHYCISRAVKIMGLGEQGIIEVPVNKKLQLDSQALEHKYHQALRDGKQVIAVVGCACATSTGAYDDLEAIGDFCHKYNLWLHVDGAHGAAVVFSNKYKHLVRGIQRADSVVLDFHKLLMTPALATALVFREGQNSFKTFAQRAQYLWEEDLEEKASYNLGKQTFECTKNMMSVKIFSILQAYGTTLFADNIDTLYDLAAHFSAIIKDKKSFELAYQPEANIVCFRYVPETLDPETLNKLTAKIRKTIIEEGEFYIVQTTIKGNSYFRTALMNPFTTVNDLKQLLIKIADVYQKIQGKDHLNFY